MTVGRKEKIGERGVVEMAEHTPGPWNVEVLKSNPNEVYVVGANGRSVAYVIHNDDERKQQRPDAALIAAAPAMLEALEYITSWNPDKGKWNPETARDLANAALAKAAGQ